MMKLRSDDRGSLPIAMLVSLVAMSLSASMVPLVVNQVTVTRASSSATSALDASQAGIDVAMAQLRAASTDADGDGISDGILENLPPCTLTGSVGPADAAVAVGYKVRVNYYDAEDTLIGGYDSTGKLVGSCPPLSVPAYAALTAEGTGATGGNTVRKRTVVATYKFRTSNANVDGGAVRIASPTTTPLCMDSGSVLAPPPARKLTMRKCVAGSGRQRFEYTKTLNLRLVGSETKTYQLGMCLDAASQTAGLNVLFQPCKEPVVGTQQWSLNDTSNFRGTSNGVSVNGQCFNLKSAGVDGSEVILGSCGAGTTLREFRSDAGVGAGMAGASTGQLTNFKQFSRCLDVTNQSPTFSYMIVWYCKQAPDGNVTWNQKWKFPLPVKPATQATGPIRSGHATSYCLKSPNSTAANQYVSMETCATTGTLPQYLQWTVFGNTDEYEKAFQIQDGFGNCLTPTRLDVSPADTHPDGTAKVKVAPCDGSELQKWNAPANLGNEVPLTDIAEK